MRRYLVVSVAVILVALAATWVVAESEPQPSSDLVRDVVKMLESGVETSVILEWLGTVENPPSGLTADDLIVLTRADAPEEVIQRMMALGSRKPSPGSAATEAPTAPARTTPSAAPQGAAGDESCCVVYFSTVYRPSYDSEDDVEDDPWTLYVYLDGAFLGRAGVGQRNSFGIGTSVWPGEHTLRLLLENHVPIERDGDQAWKYQARVAPEAIEFTVDEPGDWRLDLEWSESVINSSKGALTWTLLRDGKPQAGEQGAGTPRAEWQALCDDLEANVPPDGRTPRWVERELGNCIRWASLWPDLDPVPYRSEVRELPAR